MDMLAPMEAFATDVVGMMAASTWDVSPVAGVVVLAVAFVGFAALGVLWRTTAPSRVEPGPATMDLRDERPAVVDLLTGGFQVEDDAIPATVVDLAARRHLDIDEFGGRVTLRLRRHGSSHADELTPFEQRVITHIRQHEVGGVVPAEVLTIGPEGTSVRWFRSFTREVNRHAQSLGLCRRRFDLTHIAAAWVIVVVAAAPAWVVVEVSGRTDDPAGWGSIGNLFTGLAFLAGFALAWVAQRISRSDRQRDTADGRAAAAHWLGVRDHYRTIGDFDDKPAASVAIWDRHLGYATAMGLAPVVQRQLPFETEHDRHAWSRATGEWRRVKVRYLAFVPGWGQHPVRLAFEGLLQGAIAGALAYGAMLVAGADLDIEPITDEQRRWIGLAALIVAVFAAALCLLSLVKLALGASDLFARRTIEGEVVRARTLRTGHRLPKAVRWMAWSGTDDSGRSRDHDGKTRHYIAIDEGDDDRIVAHAVRPEFAGQAPQGSRVRVIVTPRIGYMRSIELVAPPRASVASAPTVGHELADETVSSVGRTLAGSISGAFAGLEHATDEHGRPVLDQTDESGVTLREHLAESRSGLDELRHDQRIANSPIAGLLDSFLSPPAAGDGENDRPATADPS